MTTEMLLAAAFAAGFFGSGHCLGMCGAIVSLLERPDGRWLHRLTYNTGRLGFYMLLGGVAGAIGLVLTRVPGVGAGLFVLRLLAAVLVIALALNLLFNLGSLRFLEQVILRASPARFCLRRVGRVLWQQALSGARYRVASSTVQLLWPLLPPVSRVAHSSCWRFGRAHYWPCLLPVQWLAGSHTLFAICVFAGSSVSCCSSQGLADLPCLCCTNHQQGMSTSMRHQRKSTACIEIRMQSAMNGYCVSCARKAAHEWRLPDLRQ